MGDSRPGRDGPQLPLPVVALLRVDHWPCRTPRPACSSEAARHSRPRAYPVSGLTAASGRVLRGARLPARRPLVDALSAVAPPPGSLWRQPALRTGVARRGGAFLPTVAAQQHECPGHPQHPLFLVLGLVFSFPGTPTPPSSSICRPALAPQRLPYTTWSVLPCRCRLPWRARGLE